MISFHWRVELNTGDSRDNVECIELVNSSRVHCCGSQNCCCLGLPRESCSMLVLLLNGMPLLFTQGLQEMLIGDYCFFPDFIPV